MAEVPIVNSRMPSEGYAKHGIGTPPAQWDDFQETADLSFDMNDYPVDFSYSFAESPPGESAQMDIDDESSWTCADFKEQSHRRSTDELWIGRGRNPDDPGGSGCSSLSSSYSSCSHAKCLKMRRVGYRDPDEEYSPEYFEWSLSLEKKHHPKDCLLNQPQVKQYNRSTLVNWLSKVNRSFEFYSETFFLAINVIDRFLCVTPIALECFQLLGVSALLIAAKQLEVYHPSISELLSLSAGTYTKQHFLQMEKVVLKQLRFNLVVPTCLFFLDYFLYHAELERNKQGTTSGVPTNDPSKERSFRQMAQNLLELCAQHYSLCRFLPSTMSLAAMAVVEEYAEGHPVDLMDGRFLGTSSPTLVKECATEMWKFVSEELGDGFLSEMLQEDDLMDSPATSGDRGGGLMTSEGT